MLNLINRYDAWMREGIQALALLVWDRWGIPRGYIATGLLYLFIFMIYTGFGSLLLILPLFLISLMYSHEGRQQLAGHYRKLNDKADSLFYWPFGCFLRMMMASFSFIWDIFRFFITQDASYFMRTVFLDIVLLSILYIQCTKVRDREPPEHFSFQPNAA